MIVSTAIILGIFFVLFGTLYYWWTKRHVWVVSKNIPGPKVYPWLGNFFQLIGNKPAETIPCYLGLLDEFGPVVKLFFGPKLFILMKNPEDIQKVLGCSKIRNRDWSITKAMAPFFGNGLMSLRSEEWRIRRKMVSPAFHFKILEKYVDVFGQKSKILMEVLNKVEGTVFDVYKVLSLCTLDSICETAIGCDSNTQIAGRSEFVDCLSGCAYRIYERMIRPWLLNDFVCTITSESQKAQPFIKTAHKFSESLIAKKLEDYRNGMRSSNVVTSNNKISSFLDMLIEASESQGSILSPEQIRDEVTTMAAAGLETTATTMSFFLLIIALHPEIQAEIHQEMDYVFADDSRPASVEDLRQMPVLERCIKEVLRMFPVATFLPREIDEDVEISNGYTLPAGCSVFIFSFATQRDPRNYPMPLKFWPDRWLPENADKTHPYAYLPFSAGPRNCVGQKYAQLQMKSILSQILRKYKVSTPYSMDILEKLELAMTICLDSTLEERYCIRLQPR